MRSAIRASPSTSVAEVEALVPRAQRVLLDEAVRLVARQPRLDEREQHPLAEEEAVARLEVRAHALRAVRPARRPATRTGRACSRAPGTRPGSRPAPRTSARCRARARAATFSRPTCAAARTTRARPQIRSATIGLRLCGIADEPFCPFAERLLHLAHLRAREVADLGREPVERGGDERERGEELRVPVARDDLGRDGLRLEAEPLADEPLELGIGRGVRADRAGELADAHPFERTPQPARVRGRARRPSRRA